MPVFRHQQRAHKRTREIELIRNMSTWQYKVCWFVIIQFGKRNVQKLIRKCSKSKLSDEIRSTTLPIHSLCMSWFLCISVVPEHFIVCLPIFTAGGQFVGTFCDTIWSVHQSIVPRWSHCKLYFCKLCGLTAHRYMYHHLYLYRLFLCTVTTNHVLSI